jgi:hypothetical protein
LKVESTAPVENRANCAEGAFTALADALRTHRSIKDALDWLTAQDPPRTINDLETLDEFSHDALAQFADGLWLSWSVT